MLIGLTFIIIMFSALGNSMVIPQRRCLNSGIKNALKITNSGIHNKEYERQKLFNRKNGFTLPEFTLKISKYSDSRNQMEIDEAIRKALKIWSEKTVLKFRWVENGAANIDIRFEKLDHGDGFPFDGRGNILAHAFYPKDGGALHFDDDEDWSFKDNGRTDFLGVAVHELGHSLGLRHSVVKTAVMHPYYKYDKKSIKLDPDDIQQVEIIYGNLVEKKQLLK